ncbi:aminoglycoside phosphotransferase family protein [Pseudactinotalea sp. Z1739]|uniref:aminoglycoside phosphotransferase family protein n=1 Tax=Pseudactinotalea sp. Z1739 TaxID=3413028 RepID=UPI003C79790F
MTQPPPAVPIPRSLSTGAGSTPQGAEWMRRVPDLVARAVQRWSLHLGEPFGVGTASWTAPGTLPDGTPVVLKVTYPHSEAQFEAIALRIWQGHSAVELLDHHGGDWALLMRRAMPGHLLLNDQAPPEHRLQTAMNILADLHRAPLEEFTMPSLRRVAAHWSTVATERANTWSHLYEGFRSEMQYGLDLLAAFADPVATPAPTVALHGDLNPGNVLLDAPTAGPARWLAIDPKPMVGDPGYDLWPILAQIDDPFAHSEPATVLAPRIDTAQQVLGVPARRICEWACARTVESVLWRLQTWPDPVQQQHNLRELPAVRTWATLAQQY